VDNRPIFLIAAIVLMLAALVVLIDLLVSEARRRKAMAFESGLDVVPAPSDIQRVAVDAIPTRTEREVVSDGPSAALLAPLPEGGWKAPDVPAPTAHLPAVSLAERTKQFDQPPLEAVTAVLPPLEPAPVPAPTEIEPTPEEPVSAIDAEPVAELKPLERPRAQARTIPEEPPTPAVVRNIAPAVAPPPQAPVRVDFMEMVAPVELWFGEYRVGVKSGSKTHAQFRKYADALLGDLKATGERAR
jgi:hypothetical protein